LIRGSLNRFAVTHAETYFLKAESTVKTVSVQDARKEMSRINDKK
jgi:hypothetical protein